MAAQQTAELVAPKESPATVSRETWPKVSRCGPPARIGSRRHGARRRISLWHPKAPTAPKIEVLIVHLCLLCFASYPAGIGRVDERLRVGNGRGAPQSQWAVRYHGRCGGAILGRIAQGGLDSGNNRGPHVWLPSRRHKHRVLVCRGVQRGSPIGAAAIEHEAGSNTRKWGVKPRSECSQRNLRFSTLGETWLCLRLSLWQ